MKYLYLYLPFLVSCLAAAESPNPALPEKHFTFLEKYCLDCHDADTEKGKVNLEDIPFDISTIETAEQWQKVLNSINSKEMPPEDKPQPENAEKADFLDSLANTMVAARKSLSDSGGKITMRRLNRREYKNTIEHLTGVTVEVESLPTDGGGGTFDTEGASQFISSDQFEQYLKLGRSAVDEMFARRTSQQQPSQVFRVEPETTVNVKNKETVKKWKETYETQWLPWKKGVDKAAKAPENMDVMAELRKEYPKIDTDIFRIYRNANKLAGMPDPKKYGFSDHQAATNFYHLNYHLKYEFEKHYSELPHSDTGAYLKLVWGTQRFDITPPREQLPPGTYKLRVRAGVVEGSPPERHFIEIGHPQRLNHLLAGFANSPISSHQVNGTITNPEIIEVELEIGADTPREFGIQERQPKDKKNLRNTYNRFRNKNGYGYPPAVWIDWIELEGPVSEASLTESKTYRVEPEKTINPANEKDIAAIIDTQARFTKWKAEVDKIKDTPENLAIIAEIAKTDKKQIEHPIHFYRFADKLKGAPNAQDFGFIDSAKAFHQGPKQDRAKLAYHNHYAALPGRDRGTWLKLAHGVGRVVVGAEDLAPGNYTLRVSAGVADDAPATRRFIDIGYPQRQVPRERGLVGQPIASRQVSGSIEKPEIIEIPIEIGIDTPREFAVQEKQPNNGNLKALWKTFDVQKQKNGYGFPPAIWIDWVELEGPHNSTGPKRWKQRREVELHANAKAGGTYNGYFKGGNEKAKAFIETGEPQKGIIDEREAKFRIRAFEENGPSFERYLNDPLTKTGSYLMIHNINAEEYIALPPEHPSSWRETKHVVDQLPPGDYKLRFHIGATKGAAEDRCFVELGTVPEKSQFIHLQTFQITGTTDKPQTIEVPVSLRADGPRRFALREKRDPKGDLARYRAARKKTGVGPKPALWIDWVEWEGPYNASSETSFSNWWIGEDAGVDESARARKILEQFANRALRDVSPGTEFIDRLIAIFESRRSGGDSFDVAIRTPLSVILASPGFLYLNEPGNEKQRRTLTDRELAVRLAYFLWSSPPDDQLLALAEKNQLHNPEVLRQQVNRLIADSRSDEFVSGFVHQWLDMERLDFFQFDTTLHREFDESTRSACRQEVYHSFAHLMRYQKSGQLGKLLKSDYVFINGLLGSYYGIEGVTGDEFRKVSLPADSPRGGLLGMAAIHAMGSDGVDSSPVERGAWVLRHLLHDPPPPAPANVPQLSRLADKPLSTREKLAAHMEEAQCASCHRKIDPIGFGLENFNAAGKWRTEEVINKKRKSPIDPAGAFHNGPEFADYRAMRDLIAAREDDFAQGFTEHLIEYALGRPFGFTDEDLGSEIVKAAKNKQFSVSEFVHALVQSDVFRRK